MNYTPYIRCQLCQQESTALMVWLSNPRDDGTHAVRILLCIPCSERITIQNLSPKFSVESPVTTDERLGSGGIPTAPPIPRKTEGRINVKGAD